MIGELRNSLKIFGSDKWRDWPILSKEMSEYNHSAQWIVRGVFMWSFFFFSAAYGLSQKGEIRKFKKQENDFKAIPSGSFLKGDYPMISPTPLDSNLVLIYDRHREFVPGFLMCDHEVTNAEYTEFVEYVKDSMIREKLAVQFPEFYLDPLLKRLDFEEKMDLEREDIFDLIWNEFYHLGVAGAAFGPDVFLTDKLCYTYKTEDDLLKTIPVATDSSVWDRKSLSNGRFDITKTELYSWHPAYRNYPVIAVNYEQALAYAHWKTEMLNRQYGGLKIQCEIPTESEWEWASVMNIPEKLHLFPNRQICGWDFYAVFSEFIVENGLWQIDYCLTERENISSVGSRSSGSLGIYDLGGNAFEWVKSSPPVQLADTSYFGNNIYPYKNAFKNLSFEVKEKDDEATIAVKILIANADNLQRVNSQERFQNDLDKVSYLVWQDAQLKRKLQNYRILKGGSWSGPRHHCLPAARFLVEDDFSDNTTGFRLVIHANEDILNAFLKETK